ncbi:glycoside hydrolase family 38 C-terminal domain-containing protein [Chitinophagaceae bacterium 26-R-25]|nr:glycoside hydrolase family 38 C-terminal domain-containing protein [Chitinophagaceae bacterium 26-R-25]
MKSFYCIAVLLVCILTGTAQKTVPYLGKVEWINGFDHEIEGENIRYFSAFPDYATTALLTRATDGNKVIAWETAPVPARIKGSYVYFSWVAGHSTGTSSGDRNFDLYVDDKKLLTITTKPGNQAPVWSFVAPDSSRIVFQKTKRDGANDAHGLIFLRLPVSRVKAGKPVKLKIIGQAQQSNDWFMTFKFSFQEKVDINPQPFILKNGQQPVMLTALHFGDRQTFKVTVGGKKEYSFPVEDGVNHFDIPVDPVHHQDSIRMVVSNAGKILTDKFVTLKPVTYRELNFIHHAHTDIGYSHLQPEVLKRHIKNINDALDMIVATRGYPEDAKFKWNVESLWAVEHFLEQATPEKKETFIKAVKDGYICLSAMYANILTGITMPEEALHYTDFAAQLRKTYGLRIPSAMMSDVPGFTWATVTAFAKGGVKYFSSGPNYMGETHPYLGDRVGEFVRVWGDKPVWWTSPSGEEKVLFWAGGKGYSSWHGTPPGGVFDNGPQKIATYLNELDEKKYPYDIVQWRYNIVADNGPIDTSVSRFVKQWNEKYSSPKIVLNTTDKLFEKFEQKYGKDLPVVKGDITPYWEDGAFSTAKEEGQNRINSLRLSQLTNAYAMLAPVEYNEQQFYNAWTNVLMFHEHTWGAYNSTTEPDVPFVTEQWRIKKQYMLDADSQINVIAGKLFQPLTDEHSRSIAVVNTLSWPRSGPVKINIAGKSVKDALGRKLPLQRLSDGTYVFLATNVPAFGTEIYTVSDEPATVTTSFTQNRNMLSNANVTVAWDTVYGSITQLKAKDGHNYAGTFQSQGLNSYWYVPGYDPAAAVTNQPVQMQVLESGPVVTTIALRAQAPGANSLEKRLTLYANSNAVLVENIVDKKAVRQKEGVHFGFPFDVQSGKVTLDAGYGTLRYLDDQLPGSNMDYLYGRRWMDISGAANGLQWMLLEVPMVEPGSMNDERLQVSQSLKKWKTTGEPTSLWFSYAMNNYWYTNYKADQEGVARFHYALQPHGEANDAALEMSATDFTQPLISFPVKKEVVLPKGLFQLTNAAVVVTAIVPQARGQFLIRLFNPGHTSQNTGFKWGSIKPGKITDVRNGVTKDANTTLSLPAMGVEEYLIAP